MKESQSTVLPPLLELTASQLEVALQNASSQLERLAGSIAAFTKLGAELGENPDPKVAEWGTQIAAEAQRALFAMQFHDQLVQRLRHVRDALGDMHDALKTPAPPPANVLLNAIRARYTMEDERRLFDVMLAHLPAAPLSRREKESLRGSVELF